MAISSMLLLFASGSLLVANSDGQMHCGPKMSPRLMMEIPCDMTKTAFCAEAGNGYPYASVKRYIFENQGLMRRMYGDQRHSIILRNEIDDIRDKYDSLALGGWKKYYAPRPIFGPRSFVDPLVPEQLAEAHYPSKVSTASHSTERTRSTEPTVAVAPVGQAEPSSASNLTNATETNLSPETSSPSGDFDFEDETTTTVPAVSKTPDDSTAALRGELKKDADQKDEPNLNVTSSSSVPTATSTTTPSQPEQTSTDGFETEPLEKRGVNACPVKEEVIAPYWANNTRGETLALLNVYPFEQYVHYEKCQYENSQMFCRDGCRCEQQYRLHRLLAFDPRNECRGIFSDWFKFPSCCVCICYDLPETSIFYRINRRKSRL